MPSKNSRNLILGLLILIAGVYILKRVGQSYIGSNSLVYEGIINNIIGLADTIMIGLGFLAVLVVPFWLSERSKDKDKDGDGDGDKIKVKK